MIKLYDKGVYLVNGTEIVEDTKDAVQALQSKCGKAPSKEEAARGTMAYGILEAHNTSGNMENLQIKFDKLTSHDITFVGIIQTARASGLENSRFHMSLQIAITAYVLLVEQSTKMIICLVFPVQRNTAVCMYHLIRRLFTSSPVKCLQAEER